MEAIEWLRSRVPGFAALTRADRAAINHFQLLWSLFEFRMLDRNGNSRSIEQAVRDLQGRDQLDIDPLLFALRYVKKRYVEKRYVERDATTNFRFDELRFQRPADEHLVRSVLLGNETQDAERTIALLLIIYRYRNNLHHGEKWAYDIQGQRRNFRMASRVLMSIMDM
jgi:hypothetical protein